MVHQKIFCISCNENLIFFFEKKCKRKLTLHKMNHKVKFSRFYMTSISADQLSDFQYFASFKTSLAYVQCFLER